MIAQPRPKVQPWARPNREKTLWVSVASVLPALLGVGLAFALQLPFAVALIVFFLPIQLVAAIAVGIRFAKIKGAKDAVLTVFVVFFTALVFVLLLSVLESVFTRGLPTVSAHFLYQNNRYISTTTSLEYGGVGHAILGSLLVVLITTILAVPLGLLIGVYLTTSQSKMRNLVRSFTQALSGLPSVVSGLFVLAAMSYFGFSERTGFTGALALFPLMLPTVARVAEESLRLVPQDLRWAALGLGAPNYRAFFQVILPAAKTGIMTAVLLGIARIIGETAPLLLTMSTTNGTNLNPFSGALTTLPTFIYGFLNAGYSSSIARSWGAAVVMLLLVAIIFISARVITRKPSGKGKGK
ncbi:MAG: phosphate ABC transporter permease PstA [Micrococcales bacterium]